MPRVAREGVNCWRIRRADRLAVLVDAEAYFRAIKAALLRARRSVLIIGWDFDGGIALERGEGASQPDHLGPLLRNLVREREALQVHILMWNPALFSLLKGDFLPWTWGNWHRHPRLHFISDDSHPIGAAHHQKLVVIDDRLAFIGGMDLTVERWDTRAHAPAEPRRRDKGRAYAPVHDLQAAVSGPAAAALGDLARRRWRDATREDLPPVDDAAQLPDPWPEQDLPVLLRDVEVAIARTAPAWDGEPPVHEVERLYVDMIAAARRRIYVENQYFAARRIGRSLARRLREPNGPEVVVVSCLDPTNLVERAAMGLQRARLYRRLRRFDRNDRLRLLHPTSQGHEVKVHSKLTIVDDTMLRIGSANLNNRSMGLDTECDLLLEAGGREDVRAAIAGLRQDLLAEHLGVEAAAVARAEAEAGGLVAAVERLRRQGGPRTLTALNDEIAPIWLEIAPDARFIDPDRPYESLMLENRRTAGKTGGHRAPRMLATAAAMLAGLGLLGALWPLLPDAAAESVEAILAGLPAVRPEWLAAALLVLLLAGSVLHLPVLPLVVLAAALLGLGGGLAVSLAGTLGGALALFGVGRMIGRKRVRRLAGHGMARVSRVLALDRVPAVALLRLVPVASDGLVSLAAGAIGMRFWRYVLGTLLGTVPMVLALSLFGYLLAQALARPDMLTTGMLLVVAALLSLPGFALARDLGRMTAHPAARGGGRATGRKPETGR